MSYTTKIIIGGLAGFMFFTAFTHPKSWVHKKLPQKKVKNVHVFPHIKLHKKDKTYHFHHWLVASALYLPLLALRKRIAQSHLLHGFMLGSILQGLVYKDRFRFTYQDACCVESENIERAKVKQNLNTHS